MHTATTRVTASDSQRAEILSILLTMLGLRRFASKCTVCRAWADAVEAVGEEDHLWRKLCWKANATANWMRHSPTLMRQGANIDTLPRRSWKSIYLQHCRAVRVARHQALKEAFHTVMIELLSLTWRPAADGDLRANYLLGIQVSYRPARGSSNALLEELVPLPSFVRSHQEYLSTFGQLKDASEWSLNEDGRLRLDSSRFGDLKDLRLSMFVLRTSDDKRLSLCHDLAPLGLQIDLRAIDPYFDACLEWETNFHLSSVALQISAFMNRPAQVSPEALIVHVDENGEELEAQTRMELSIYMPKLQGTSVLTPFGPREPWGTLGRREFFGLLESSDLWV